MTGVLRTGRVAALQRLGLMLAGGTLVAFLLTPLMGLISASSWQEVQAGLQHPLVWPALRLSLFTTSISLALVTGLGTPLAWLLGRTRSRRGRWLETLVQLPIVTPPAVAGLALLLAFGRRGPLAGLLYPESWSIAFTPIAVIMAEVFVSAPFFIQAATAAFRHIDDDTLLAARSLGASPLRVFVRIGIPLALPGLLAGAAMSWARSLGEFGATLMFAGNLSGRTQTLPLAIYTALEADLRVAQALALILLCVAFILLLVIRAGFTARSPNLSR